MLRASVRGLIDFSQADFESAEWWRLLRLTLEGLEQDDDVVLLGQMLQYHLALVGNSGLTDDSFKRAQKSSRGLLYDLLGRLRPWEGVDAKEVEERERASLVSRHRRVFGDNSSPEAQARIRAEAEAWARSWEAHSERARSQLNWQQQAARNAAAAAERRAKQGR